MKVIQRYVAYLEAWPQNHLVSQGLGDWYDIGPCRSRPVSTHVEAD